MRAPMLAATVCLIHALPARGEPVVVSGKVTDEAGKPVAGADVWTWAYVLEERARCESDERGSFRLEFEPGERQYWQIHAIAPGLAVARANHNLADPAPILLRLPPESVVRGVVTDDEGQPVRGATVSVTSLKGAGADPADPRADMVPGHGNPLAAPTDEQGRFRLGHLPKGAQVNITVEADGFATWTRWSAPGGKEAIAGADEEYNITLMRAAVIAGTVTHDGQPVEGVRLFAQGTDDTNYGDEATTDALGRYHMGRLGPGTYNVMIRDTEELIARAREDIRGVPGETVEGVDFALTPGGIIEGRIVDADTGEGIAGVRAGCHGTARPRSSAGVLGAKTDDEGVYTLRVAPGSNYVYYMGGSLEYPFDQERNFTLDVREGQTVGGPDLAVRRAQPFTVRVTDADGNPAPDVTVVCFTDWQRPYQTDEKGECEVFGMRAGRPLVFVAEAGDGKLSGAAVVEAAASDEPVTITLQASASVELRVVDMQYEPVAGLGVSAFVVAKAAPDADLPFYERHVRAVIRRAASDENGLVRFEALPAWAAPQFSVEERVSNRIEWPECPRLTPGQRLDLGEVLVDLTKMPVKGTVLLADGTPIKGGHVRTSRWNSPTVRTDDEGRFTIEGLLPSERLLLLAASPDWKLFGAEEVVPDWELEPGIILTELVRVTGQMIDRDGNPVAGRRVRLSPSISGMAGGFPVRAEAKTDADGMFAFERVMAGPEYDLVLLHPDGAGGLVEYEFRLEPGADLDLGPIQATRE